MIYSVDNKQNRTEEVILSVFTRVAKTNGSKT